jgi:hypothetical protein
MVEGDSDAKTSESTIKDPADLVDAMREKASYIFDQGGDLYISGPYSAAIAAALAEAGDKRPSLAAGRRPFWGFRPPYAAIEIESVTSQPGTEAVALNVYASECNSSIGCTVGWTATHENGTWKLVMSDGPNVWHPSDDFDEINDASRSNAKK